MAKREKFQSPWFGPRTAIICILASAATFGTLVGLGVSTADAFAIAPAVGISGFAIRANVLRVKTAFSRLQAAKSKRQAAHAKHMRDITRSLVNAALRYRPVDHSFNRQAHDNNMDAHHRDLSGLVDTYTVMRAPLDDLMVSLIRNGFINVNSKGEASPSNEIPKRSSLHRLTTLLVQSAYRMREGENSENIMPLLKKEGHDIFDTFSKDPVVKMKDVNDLVAGVAKEAGLPPEITAEATRTAATMRKEIQQKDGAKRSSRGNRSGKPLPPRTTIKAQTSQVPRK